MKYHMCMDIQGALNRIKHKRSNSDSFFTDDKGRTLSIGEARENLKKELYLGKMVLPMAECDNFCDQKGCLGHESNTTNLNKGE